jgi:hypothetical protein
MHIHAGNRIIVSDKKIVGIFNTETILMSQKNSRFFDKIKPEDRTIIIDRSDNAITTGVSSFTVTKRTELQAKFVWRRKNDSIL